MIQQMQGQTVELDLVGQFYASIITRNQSCVFAVSVCLKESVNPQALQQAVNDLICRLPFLNMRLKRSFFHFKGEILAEPPQIKPENEEPLFSPFFKRGSGHMICVSYGEQHFTVQTTHVVCDGRSLTKIASSLLVRYFEILGVDADKSGVVDCSQSFKAEEAENAYERYVKHNAIPAGNAKSAPNIKAYRYKASRTVPQQVLTRVFDAEKIKETAKKYNATVTEFILFQIFSAIRKERDDKGDKRPITSLIPVDCRSFFPSKSMRSFVSGTTVTMPDTNDAFQSIQQIKTQFKKINQENVLKDIGEIQNMYHSARYVPRVLKAVFMKMMARSEAHYNSTGFSNVGLIKLPSEIENHVEHIEFLISLEEDAPYFFSCATIGKALALAGIFRDEGQCVVETVMKGMMKSM